MEAICKFGKYGLDMEAIYKVWFGDVLQPGLWRPFGKFGLDIEAIW
jgi:hypothetical protein